MKISKNKKGVEKAKLFQKKALFATSLLLLILATSCSKQTTSEDSDIQTVTGNVVVKIEEPSSSEADYNVCNNAVTYNLCDKLDKSLREGYKEACCNKHNLCC